MKRIVSGFSFSPGFLFLYFITIQCCHAQTHAVPDTIKSIEKHILKLADTAKHHAMHGRRKEAMHYHQQILHHAKKFNLPEHEARSLLGIANILKEEDSDKSIEYLYSALRISQKIRHPQLTADIYHALSETYKQHQNYQLSLFALEEHQKLLDSLFAMNKAKEISRLKIEEKRKIEQMAAIFCISGIAIIAAVFALYFYRTKRLNKKLRELNAVKDKLFSILGHDLRAPAGNIVQTLSMTASGNLPATTQKELMTLSLKQGEAFLETLDSLLTWGKSQLQGTEVRPTIFLPASIVDKNIGILTGLADKKQLAFHQQVPGSLSVFADKDHFDFIIRNLLSNAVKFSRPRGVITIAGQQDKKGTIFSVKDEGIGISPENQKQFGNGTLNTTYGTDGEKGTGLGLLLTKEFIKAAGGRIWVESIEGKGTTFYFSLPAKGES